MSTSRVFSRDFKLAALSRMAAGENVSALSREVTFRRKLPSEWRDAYRAGGAEALRGLSLLILSLLLSTQAAAQTPDVVSGDTLEFGGITMRLHGVVAPHLDETCVVDGEEVPVGRLAADALRDLIEGQLPDCRPIENRHRFDADFVVRCDIYRPKDSDGRLTIERADLGRLIVEHGIAWEFIAESHLRYSPAEARAASAGRGVWASDCKRPWVIPPE